MTILKVIFGQKKKQNKTEDRKQKKQKKNQTKLSKKTWKLNCGKGPFSKVNFSPKIHYTLLYFQSHEPDRKDKGNRTQPSKRQTKWNIEMKIKSLFWKLLKDKWGKNDQNRKQAIISTWKKDEFLAKREEFYQEKQANFLQLEISANFPIFQQISKKIDLKRRGKKRRP